MMKQVVVLASILKPVNDVRLYQKIGKTLAKSSPEDEFHLVGFQPFTLPPPSLSNIHFHPIFSFKRLSLARFKAGFSFFRKLWQLKPDIVVVATFELLLPACIYTWFRKVKLVYDVQENYYRNIRYTQVFPRWSRIPIASMTRSIERLVHFRIHQYLLAETCYFHEMPFMQSKGVLIANKLQATIPQPSTPPKRKIKKQFVYTGTISRDYGVFQAIEWVQRLYAEDPAVQLIIIGYCPKVQDWEQLQVLQQQHAFIRLIGGTHLVSHDQILQALQQATFALLPYQVNKSVKNRIPTKFYECIATQTPMLVQVNQAWNDFIQQYQAGTLIDFQNLSQATEQWHQVKQKVYYNNLPKNPAIYWKDEALKLIETWNNL